MSRRAEHAAKSATSEEEHSEDEQWSRINITSFICKEASCLRQRDAAAAGEGHSAAEYTAKSAASKEEHSADMQRNRVNFTSSTCAKANNTSCDVSSAMYLELN
jgi:hypothetical protein